MNKPPRYQNLSTIWGDLFLVFVGLAIGFIVGYAL